MLAVNKKGAMKQMLEKAREEKLKAEAQLKKENEEN